MRSIAWLALGFSVVSFACGDDTSSGGSSSTAGSGPGGAGGAGGVGAAGAAGGDGGGAQGGGGAGPGGAGPGGSGAGGAGPDCTGLPTDAVDPVEVFTGFDGSEDIGFDGAGGLVGKDGNALVRVDAADVVTNIAQVPGQSFGVRVSPAGDIFVARPNAGTIVKVTNGTVTDVMTGLSGPNGVHIDSAGHVWVTEFGGGRVIKLDAATAATTVIADNQNSPNGVVLDEARNLLFFTSYSQGRLFKTDPAGGGAVTEIGQINGASLDGLALDACGNVYAVDQANSRLYRFDLDANANLVGAPLLLAQFPTNVANAQFGVGAGWNATSLYAAGNPGVVFEVAVGVSGAQ